MFGMLLHAAVETVRQLYAVWAVIGAGMACTLHESVFAFPIRAYPNDFRRRRGSRFSTRFCSVAATA